MNSKKGRNEHFAQIKKRQTISKKQIAFGLLSIFIIGNLLTPSVIGEFNLYFFRNNERNNDIGETDISDNNYVFAIGPLGCQNRDECTILCNISQVDADDIHDIFFCNGFFRNNHISLFDVFGILKKYGIIKEEIEYMDFINRLKNLENTPDYQAYSNAIGTDSHLCVGPHFWIYASYFGSIFAYNIQGINLKTNISVIKDYFEIDDDNPLLYSLLNVFTENLSIMDYMDIKGAQILVGSSLGRYFSFGLFDSAFGDMTFRIVGPFVAMHALVVDFGLYVFENPKDGKGVEKPWLDVAMGISMFSMDLQTTIDFDK